VFNHNLLENNYDHTEKQGIELKFQNATKKQKYPIRTY